MKLIQIASVAFLLLVVMSYIFGDSKPSNTAPVANAWYQGGTLGDATIGQWLAATDHNRLATAADWTTGVIGQSEFERIGLEGVRVKAESLVKCISDSTMGLQDAEAMTAKEIGAACIMLMKW